MYIHTKVKNMSVELWQNNLITWNSSSPLSGQLAPHKIHNVSNSFQ